MQLVDTHCHIHSEDYPLPVEAVEARALQAGVTRLICVGTDAEDSRRAVEFARSRPHCWASVGLHPHEAKAGEAALHVLKSLLEGDHHNSEAPNNPAPPSVEPPHISVLGAPKEGTPNSSSFRAEFGRSLWGRTHDASFTHTNTLTASNPPSLVASGNLPPSSQAAGGGLPPFAPLGAGAVVGTLIGRWSWGGARHGDKGLAEREPGGPLSNKIVAIGECGLDYFYNNSSKTAQKKALRFQVELALEYNLPLIFHIRDAFDDFWPIFDSYQGIRGVVHSFTDTRQNLDKLLERGLFVGVNGITTFTKLQWQLDNARSVPLGRLLLETDAPFLTPAPLRGRINEPAHVALVLDFLAELRNESIETIAQSTTRNARQLFFV